MSQKTRNELIALIFLIIVLAGLYLVRDSLTGFAILSPLDDGFGGETRENNYYHLIDAIYENPNVTSVVGDKLWVPWYTTASSCTINELHSGNSCNSGETIDLEHNCMVTDELSQIGILASLSNNETRMDQYYNLLLEIDSDYGSLPAWKVYRNGSIIQKCINNINQNCDTASDADARIIYSLFTASNNTHFSESKRDNYRDLANTMLADFVEYEIVYDCKQSDLGHGNICYWLASGSEVANFGLGTTNFAFTGYYSDAVIMLLQACSQTRNETYCAIASNITLNYLQASKFDNQTFTVPPGMAFKWTNLSGVPVAECTNTCNPVQWDAADAPRALGICQANYYASLMDYTLPGLERYCEILGNTHMNNPNSAPYQFYPDGTPVHSYQSGYFAQGLQALFHFGGHNISLVEETLDNALGHYNPSTKRWDSQQCFGIYDKAFAVRALGTGIGKDENSFRPLSNSNNNESTPLEFTYLNPSGDIELDLGENQTFEARVNKPAEGSTIEWILEGDTIQTTNSNDSDYIFVSSDYSAGDYDLIVRASFENETIVNPFSIEINEEENSENSGSSGSSGSTGNNSNIDLNKSEEKKEKDNTDKSKDKESDEEETLNEFNPDLAGITGRTIQEDENSSPSIMTEIFIVLVMIGSGLLIYRIKREKLKNYSLKHNMITGSDFKNLNNSE